MFVMFLPAVLWSHFVVQVHANAVVGTDPGLSNGDRILLYLGDLAFVFLAYAVYASAVQGLYRLFQDIELRYWTVFSGLVVTGILAAIVAFWFPFLGIVIAIFGAPILVNRMAREDPVPGAGM
jgi:hypothetical protein